MNLLLWPRESATQLWLWGQGNERCFHSTVVHGRGNKVFIVQYNRMSLMYLSGLVALWINTNDSFITLISDFSACRMQFFNSWPVRVWKHVAFFFCSAKIVVPIYDKKVVFMVEYILISSKQSREPRQLWATYCHAHPDNANRWMILLCSPS